MNARNEAAALSLLLKERGDLGSEMKEYSLCLPFLFDFEMRSATLLLEAAVEKSSALFQNEEAKCLDVRFLEDGSLKE